MIPLLTLGIPGSPPAVMLLGALMLHGVNPGPMITFERPGFLVEVTAVMLLASLAMWINGMLLARQVVKILRVPTTIFLPVVAVLCVIGSYSLGLNIVNLYLMVPVGIAAYFLTEMEYPISPLVIGVILGPMADENLRRALMVSGGRPHGVLHAPRLVAAHRRHRAHHPVPDPGLQALARADVATADAAPGPIGVIAGNGR